MRMVGEPENARSVAIASSVTAVREFPPQRLLKSETSLTQFHCHTGEMAFRDVQNLNFHRDFLLFSHVRLARSGNVSLVCAAFVAAAQRQCSSRSSFRRFSSFSRTSPASLASGGRTGAQGCIRRPRKLKSLEFR